MSVVRSVASKAATGPYGWMGGVGTSFLVDPRVRMTVILMTRRLMPRPDDVAAVDAVQTLAYQAMAS